MGWLLSRSLRISKSTWITALLFLPLAGCDLINLEGSRQDSRVFENMANVPGGLTPEEILQVSAFQLLRGQSRNEAVNYLSSDGFDCINYLCSKVVVEQEIIAIGLRPPGPVRTFRRQWTLLIQSDVIRTLNDLVTTFDVVVQPPY